MWKMAWPGQSPGESSRSGPYSGGPRNRHATGCKCGSNRSACAELRRTGGQAGRYARSENPKAQKRERRQNKRESIFKCWLIGAEPLGELAKERGPDADDDGKHQHLDA